MDLATRTLRAPERAPDLRASLPRVEPRAWRGRLHRSLSLWDPRSFSDADVRALWRFRACFVDLKPHIDPEADFADFADFVRGADFAWVWLADDGAVLGTCFHRSERHEVDGRAYTVVHSEYGYTASRGGNSVVLAQFAVYLAATLRAREAIYFGGLAYPHGYPVFALSFPRIWLLGEDTVPADARALAEHLGAAWAGDAWDPARRRVAFRTLPREAPNDRGPARQRLLAHYEALNPEWRAGHGLLLLGRLDLASVPSLLGGLARRLRRR